MGMIGKHQKICKSRKLYGSGLERCYVWFTLRVHSVSIRSGPEPKAEFITASEVQVLDSRKRSNGLIPNGFLQIAAKVLILLLKGINSQCWIRDNILMGALQGEKIPSGINNINFTKLTFRGFYVCVNGDRIQLVEKKVFELHLIISH